jgi:hypothetical protein
LSQQAAPGFRPRKVLPAVALGHDGVLDRVSIQQAQPECQERNLFDQRRCVALGFPPQCAVSSSCTSRMSFASARRPSINASFPGRE